MTECVFCKIVRGEEEAETIYESEKVISFMDANPRAPGHALVIPKEHAELLAELEDESAGELLKVAKKVSLMIRRALDPDGLNIGINDGEAAGQVIPHLHMNIIPRFEGDGGQPIQAIVENPPSEEISEIAEKIRSRAE